MLDPFNGSGTTCVAAKRLNRNWFGIDTSEEYVKLATERLLKNGADLEPSQHSERGSIHRPGDVGV